MTRRGFLGALSRAALAAPLIGPALQKAAEKAEPVVERAAPVAARAPDMSRWKLAEVTALREQDAFWRMDLAKAQPIARLNWAHEWSIRTLAVPKGGHVLENAIKLVPDRASAAVTIVTNAAERTITNVSSTAVYVGDAAIRLAPGQSVSLPR
jgi:hypothetical protein